MDDFGPERDMTVTDPVCGMCLALEKVAAREEYRGWAYFFCSSACHCLFKLSPERFSEKSETASANAAPRDAG